jgi:hypothetical protein
VPPIPNPDSRAEEDPEQQSSSSAIVSAVPLHPSIQSRVREARDHRLDRVEKQPRLCDTAEMMFIDLRTGLGELVAETR